MSLSEQTEQRIVQKARTVVDADPVRALQQAQSSWRSAQLHKARARHHKAQARVEMVTFNAFKRNLEALGIRVIIEDHRSMRRTSDARSKNTN